MTREFLNRKEFDKRFDKKFAELSSYEFSDFRSSLESAEAYDMYKKQSKMSPEDYAEEFAKFKEDGISLDSIWQLPRHVSGSGSINKLQFLLRRLEATYDCKTVDDILNLTQEEVYCTSQVGQVVYRNLYLSIESYYKKWNRPYPKVLKSLLNSVDKCETFKLIIPTMNGYASLRRFITKWNKNNSKQQIICLK